MQNQDAAVAVLVWENGQQNLSNEHDKPQDIVRHDMCGEREIIIIIIERNRKVKQ